MRSGPSDGWILGGMLDGKPARPALDEQLIGVPHLLRLACEMALAGCSRITVVWFGTEPMPDVRVLAADPRLATRATLAIASEPPRPTEPVLIVRADRVFHRDIPRQAVAAWRTTAARLGKVRGTEHDAVVVVDGAGARELAEAAPTRDGFATVLARLTAAGEVAVADEPYLAFTMATPDRLAMKRAERRLVWTLRKAGDGIAAKHLNRYISLPISWLLARTPVLPNHITVLAFLCALAGGIVISRGGYAAGVLGMLLVEWGSIIDGVDGELARLRFQFSRLGQWLDTLADDFGNIAYVTGIAINLYLAGVTWAAPLAICSLSAFAITQGTQYYLLATVYRSGDLAAIPWAFQSTEFLTQRPAGLVPWIKATIPRLCKRDFALTMFLVLAIADRLDIVLLMFALPSIVFLGVFWVQYFRYGRASIRAARAARG